MEKSKLIEKRDSLFKQMVQTHAEWQEESSNSQNWEHILTALEEAIDSREYQNYREEKDKETGNQPLQYEQRQNELAGLIPAKSFAEKMIERVKENVKIRLGIATQKTDAYTQFKREHPELFDKYGKPKV